MHWIKFSHLIKDKDMGRKYQLHVYKKLASMLILLGVLFWIAPSSEVVAQSNEDILAALVIREHVGNNLGGIVNAAEDMRVEMNIYKYFK